MKESRQITTGRIGHAIPWVSLAVPGQTTQTGEVIMITESEYSKKWKDVAAKEQGYLAMHTLAAIEDMASKGWQLSIHPVREKSAITGKFTLIGYRGDAIGSVDSHAEGVSKQYKQACPSHNPTIHVLEDTTLYGLIGQIYDHVPDGVIG